MLFCAHCDQEIYVTKGPNPTFAHRTNHSPYCKIEEAEHGFRHGESKQAVPDWKRMKLQDVDLLKN